MRRGLAAFAACLTVAAAVPATAAAARFPLGDAVDTRIGSAEGAEDFGTGGGGGNTYPGAVAPFGMLQFSPDTDPSIANYAGGYSYDDTRIKGFSLTHISGAGCAGAGDVPILPTTAPVDASPSTPGSFDVDPRYVSSFTHEGEVAKPGDYRVRLGDMRAALTANARAGAMRVAFPAGKPASFLVNAGGSSMGNDTADLAVDPGRREITGSVGGGGFCFAPSRYKVFFAVRFDRAFEGSGTWQRQTLQPNGREVADRSVTVNEPLWAVQYKRLAGAPDELPGHPSTGAQAGAYASFGARTVTARVAISSVSVENARANLDAGGKASFAKMRKAARATWERLLGKVRITGGARKHRSRFYTALYDSLVMPSVFSDVDGRYRGMDGEVHTAKGFKKYANISGWDTYRAQMPLMAILAPKAASDLVSSMVADWRESGHLPKWPVREGHTNVMVGDPADLLIAGAHAFGARDFDAKAALRAMVDGATKPGRSKNAGYVQRAGLEDYLRLGYVGYERNTSSAGQSLDPTGVWGTSATTMEYALADFGIARLAAATGDRATCTTFAARSGNWQNVIDPDTRTAAPRLGLGGLFVKGLGPASEDGFVEGSAEQYTWFVPHDVAGLADKLGGREAALQRLDGFLAKINTGGKSAQAFLGNEPTLHTPYLYDWLGKPGTGAAKVREALLTLYDTTPGGFPGNDDGGSMSAWWVFSALGMHPSTPGSDVLTFGSPLFKRAQISLGGKRTIDIRAPKAAPNRPYVRAAWLGKKPLTRTWMRWADLRKGAKLRFSLSASDGAKWGTDAKAAPPSFAPDAVCG